MSIALLKRLNQSLPDPVQIAFAPLIRKKLVCDDVFIAQMDELHDRDIRTDEEIKERQFQKLKETLLHAYRHTSYYRQLFDKVGFRPDRFASFEDIKKIPLLTKDQIRENFDGLRADDRNDHYVGETGGSTGQPLKVLLGRDSIYREKAFIYHFWEKFGYDRDKSRIATFRGVDLKGKLSKVNPLYNEVLLNPFILSDANVQRYVERIEQFGADLLHGYPSALSDLCRLMDKHHIRLSRPLKAVFLISEACSDQQRRLIEGVLGCRAVSFYGHTERAVFAEECSRDGNYRFDPYYGHTEIVEHENGNIVCTGFINPQFPLIRYAVDDRAVKDADGTYKITGHHTAAALLGKNGEHITQTALNFHDATFSKTTGYQFYQEIPGYVQCRVQAAEKLGITDLNDIKRGLSRKCGDCIEWDVVQVDHFELTKRGKLKTIIQKM